MIFAWILLSDYVLITYTPLDYALTVLGLIAAWSMGHHYAGAVVGPAYGSRSLTMYTAILISGAFVIIGAVSTRVVTTYVSLAAVPPLFQTAALLSLVIMTNVTTSLKIPTSTIQLYAFSLLGVAFETGSHVNYAILGFLVIGWIAAPSLSFGMSRGIFRVLRESKHLRYVIIGVMMYSGLVLGLNDVSNAASSLVSAGINMIFSKAICGIAMFFGMLIFGPRLIKLVGEEMIKMDYRTAASAQLTKSIIISGLNALGFNASINQTVVTSLASLGARKHVLKGILQGWIYSPLIGFASALIFAFVLKLVFG